jgi:hypothetical protein
VQGSGANGTSGSVEVQGQVAHQGAQEVVVV